MVLPYVKSILIDMEKFIHVFSTLAHANKIFPLDAIHQSKLTPFVRAMPEEFKFDMNISTIEAYKMYIASKPWVCEELLKITKSQT